MRIISFANQKGGVGKTTTTVNLAGKLAEWGKEVLLIDLDPQAHLTTFLGISPDDFQYSSYSVLMESIPIEKAQITVRDNIKMLAAELNLAAAEQELVAVLGRETRLHDALEKTQDHYDYVLIDCPPSLGLLTVNALCAAREVFIPIQAHFLSLQGLSQLLESLILIKKRINPDLRVSGLLFCMFDARTSLSTEIVRDIESFFSSEDMQNELWKDIRLFRTRIRRNIKLAESPSHGQTIFEYEPHCNGTDDYTSLAAEILEMVGETPPQTRKKPTNNEADSAIIGSNRSNQPEPGTKPTSTVQESVETIPADSTIKSNPDSIHSIGPGPSSDTQQTDSQAKSQSQSAPMATPGE